MTADEPAHADPETLLSRLRRLDAEATPPRWRVKPATEYEDAVVVIDEGDHHNYNASWAEIPNTIREEEQEGVGDCSLIVAMRNALPRLLAVVEAAEDVRPFFKALPGTIAWRLRDALGALEEPG